LALAGESQVLCENDAVAGSVSSVTIICHSLVGKLLKIGASDFIKQIKEKEDSWVTF